MSSFNLFETLYHFFSKRRTILYSSFCAVILLSIAAFKNINMSENIASMLPEDQIGESGHFELLQQAPFSRKLMINLKRREGVEKETLIHAVDRLAEVMKTPYFSRVITGPEDTAGEKIFSWMNRTLPNLITEKDVKKIKQRLVPEKLRYQIQDLFERLLTPEGWIIKGMIQSDPLELRNIGFKKLGYIKLIPEMRLEENHFVSADGMNALLIADTPLAITDSSGSGKLIEHFNKLVSENVSSEIEVSLIGGHVYSVANANAIKRDVFIILGCSTLAIIVLFLVFLRSWRAFFVFLVPVSVLCIACVGVAGFYREVSAITIGFGSVLLGISVDFALHVYFAIRGSECDPGVVTGQIAYPVLFGGLTTIGAFSVLFLSHLPGQRQMAVFSIIGMSSALIVALTVLPHLIKRSEKTERWAIKDFGVLYKKSNILILVTWILISAFCVWQARNIRIDGDLQSLNMVPPEIRHAENHLKSTWGNIRGSAMVFVQEPDVQKALETNDRLFSFLTKNLPEANIVSLAPVLPSRATQEKNLRRWHSFWSAQNKERVQSLLVAEGEALGFSSDAFSPFFESLNQPTIPFEARELRDAGLGSVLESLLIRSETDQWVRILTLVPDTPRTHELMKTAEERYNVRLVSQSRFNEQLSSAIQDDFIRFILRAAIVVILLLFALFRNSKHVLCSLIPVVTGLVFMFGIMGWQNIGFNLFNIVAAILIIGLGVDYGIFMVMKILNGYRHNTDLAVFVSGLTTLAGFGALILARHPALHSIGITVLLGISAAIPSALLVIPIFYRKQ